MVFIFVNFFVSGDLVLYWYRELLGICYICYLMDFFVLLVFGYIMKVYFLFFFCMDLLLSVGLNLLF